jgi:TRAP-type C4-dicarboxylate transport system permease small subunit
MKQFLATILLALLLSFAAITAQAQCSICTRTAQQLGEKPAQGLNAGIIYLAFTPLAIVGFIGYKWWKKTNSND